VTFGEVIGWGLAGVGVVRGRVMRFTHRFCTVTHTRPTGYASGLTLTKTYVYFIQRPLCKVDAKLSTEKLTPTAYIPSYPQAGVDNPRKNPVDNPWLAVPPARAGGGGPAAKGHGDGTPTNIF
jgi:hypothetical protein